MKKIYAPWRKEYITDTVHKPKDNRPKTEANCVFCQQLKDNVDEKYFIIKRYNHAFVIMNRYPYNGGHLMILPIEHKGELDACTVDERAEMMELINTCITILKQELKPQGFNVGINTGRAGGGGIPSHLHIHVLPRWDSDTNFMPLLCETKPISIELKTTYLQLKKAFDKYS
ncbi:HIT domain-containing protein [Candidatus Dependentiae bacterium]|nr:HIT domain-containing protein [Candidatus Dependentiae bacterium]